MFKLAFCCILISLSLLISCSDTNKVEDVYKWPLIEGLPLPYVPADNPMSNAKVLLGKHLFYDNNLSFNRTQSCNTCHQQTAGFGDRLDTSIGSEGHKLKRNSQVLINVAYNKTLTWSHDGLTTLEQQILIPMFGENPIELGITGHEEDVLARFKSEKYNNLFESAFPGEEVSFNNIVKALASFVRSLVSLNSDFDKYAYLGDDNALSESALRGMELFFSEQFECHHCHGGFNFTQSTSHEQQLLDRRPFHNTGLYNIENGSGQTGYPIDDVGLAEITLNPRDNGRFRAPTLRNIELSAPYMHDGSVKTLSEVLDLYAAGGRNITEGVNKGDGRINPLKSAFVKGFDMTEKDKADLIAFLKSLTDKEFINNSEFAAPE